MANKPEIICVYQDCPMCGDRGKKLKQFIDTKGLAVRKVSFASDEGKDLIAKALFEHKIGQMPFFTDGEIFSTNIEDLIAKPAKKVKKPVKNKKGVDDGVDG